MLDFDKWNAWRKFNRNDLTHQIWVLFEFIASPTYIAMWGFPKKQELKDIQCSPKSIKFPWGEGNYKEYVRSVIEARVMSRHFAESVINKIYEQYKSEQEEHLKDFLTYHGLI